MMISLLLLCFFSANGIDVIEESAYWRYKLEESWLRPACFLIHNNESLLVRSYEKTIQNLSEKNHLEDFVFYQYIQPSLNTSRISCYYGGSQPIELLYDKPRSKSLYKWFTNQVVTHHTNIIPLVRSTSINDVIKEDNVYIVVIAPGFKYFTIIEQTFKQLAKSCEADVCPLIIPPNTNIEREFVEKRLIQSIPTIQIYHRKYHYNALRLVDTLVEPYDINENKIQMIIVLHQMQYLQLDHVELGNFMSKKNYVNNPCVILLYLTTDDRSYRYLHAFQRTFNYFHQYHHDTRIQFHVADLSVPENNVEFSRHVRHSDISIPYVMITYKSQDGDEVQQVSMKSLIPTPFVTETYLRHINVLKQVKEEEIESSNEMKCSMNSTSTCWLGDYPFPSFDNQSFHGPLRNKIKSKKRHRSIGGLSVITEASWADVFSYNDVQTVDHFLLKYNYQSRQSRLVMIIFMSGDCSYCKVALKEFQLLAKAVKYIPNTSVYLMNCTKNRAKCKEYHITGYPTILLFRLLPSLQHHQCIPHNLLSMTTQINYHGNYEHKEILNWLSKFTATNLQFVKSIDDVANITMVKDLQLIATYYKKSYIKRYISRRLATTMIPLSCFHTLCEIFYADVTCVAVPRDNVNDVERDEEMFLVSLEFERSDNFHVNIHELNTPLQRLLLAENSELQSFDKIHQPHRYSFPSHDFRCENDHEKCFDFFYNFINDHSRLPITHVTNEMFHSHQRGISYLWKRPILLALVYKDNMTTNSLFYKDLYDLAVEMYGRINVAVIDVELNHDWSNLFVPRGYYMQDHDSTDIPLLNKYPRFCMINLDEHDKAAFFPPITDGLSEANDLYMKNKIPRGLLEDFIDRYFEDKHSLVVNTEQF